MSDVLTDEELQRQARIGLRPPTLDPARAQAIAGGAAMPAPVLSGGAPLSPSTLDLGSQVNTRVAPASPGGLPDPNDPRYKSLPRTGVLARLGEVGLAIAGGPNHLQDAINWHDNPQRGGPSYAADRQHALDEESQRNTDSEIAARENKPPHDPFHVTPGEMVQNPDGSFSSVGTKEEKPGAYESYTVPGSTAPVLGSQVGNKIMGRDGQELPAGAVKFEKPPTVPEAEKPLGDKVPNLNSVAERRWQVMHPKQPLPKDYILPANATQGDYTRREKALDDEEHAHQTLQAHFDAQANAAAAKTDKRGEAGLNANEKFWTDPHTGFVGALQQANQTKKSIVAGADGNGLLTNLVPTMEVLGINHAAGINRVSPSEAVAAGTNPQWATRWNAWASKVGTGKLTAELAKEGNELMDIVVDAAHSKAIQSSKFTAKSHGLTYDQVPAMDRAGNLTTLDKVGGGALPTGAVPGSMNGKRGYVLNGEFHAE